MSACADVAALTATVPLPDDPATRASIATTSTQLDRADALHGAGKYPEEAAVVGAALPRARALRYPPLLARALIVSGTSELAHDNFAVGEQRFAEATRTAAAARDDAAALRAWQGMTQARINAGHYDDALALRLQLESALARIGDEPAARAEVLLLTADALWQKARFAEARTLIEEALALRQRRFGPDSWQVADATNQLGNVLAETGDLAAARRLLERALAATSRALGRRHPRTGLATNNLALTVRDLGDYRAALPLFDEALAILQEALGPDAVEVGRVWNNLAGVRDVLERPDAKEAFLRAVAIKEKALGPDHASLALSLLNLGSHLKRTGHPGEAEPYLRRALAIQEKALGADHPEHRLLALPARRHRLQPRAPHRGRGAARARPRLAGSQPRPRALRRVTPADRARPMPRRPPRPRRCAPVLRAGAEHPRQEPWQGGLARRGAMAHRAHAREHRTRADAHARARPHGRRQLSQGWSRQRESPARGGIAGWLERGAPAAQIPDLRD